MTRAVSHDPRQTVTRREFLRRLGCAAIALVPAGSFVDMLLEPRWLKVYRTVIAIPGLPAVFSGLRLVQLTDIHHGPFLDIARVREAVSLANSLQPDLVALTGDYVHRDRKYIVPCFGALAGLRAPLGVFGVLGNHDHWESASETRSSMQRAGVVELTNTGRCVLRQGQRLYIAGVGDLWEDEQNLDQAMAGVPGDATAILLSHNPDYNEQMDDPRVKLTLAGHTHGGQVVLPLIGPPLVPSKFGRKYVSGLVRDGAKQVYVSRGVGCVTPPIRFRCRPEVTLLTLRPA